MSRAPGLFTREGHLLDLSLDRALLGELDAPQQRELDAHVAECEVCAGRMLAARSLEAQALLPPPRRTGEAGRAVLPFPGAAAQAVAQAPTPEPEAANPRPGLARRMAPWMAAAAAFAAVALVTLRDDPTAPLPPEPSGEFRPKGAQLELQVHLKEADGTRQLAHGDAVDAGDRLAFRALPKREGHLLVLGIDGMGETYPCWPQRAPLQGQAVSAQTEFLELGAAIQLDATPGQERLVAVLCDDPFSYEGLAPLLKAAAPGPDGRLGSLRAGCAQSEVVLHKSVAEPR